MRLAMGKSGNPAGMIRYRINNGPVMFADSID